ncbi:MAG TPA: hypothetical protein VMQ46_09145 [Acidimicrobiia bacterium]|jgi:hypothetical protein|nr:hypothetical protein [Acidimicrobiia bacterium]
MEIEEICGWTHELDTEQRGEFWIDRARLTKKMSELSPTQRAFLRWGIIERFNKGLEDILLHDQAIGEMRHDLEDQ